MYAAELAAAEAAQAKAQRQERALGIANLLVAAGTLFVAALLIHDKERLVWLLLPCAAFTVLAVVHSKLLGAIRLRDRAIRFYGRGLARLEGR
ncbi:MAG TPA: hypothetical protein VMU71_06755, partial [Terracidiphilus sp.]|nr:hypothetical protein [Terracidiphilus sp.]